jgi:D-lactate dehydrogenase (cytochrome)
MAGSADSISFPENDDEVIEVLKKMYSSGTQVTIQGSRTGLSGGAVPFDGHIINLKKMDRILGSQRSQTSDAYTLRVQPGLLLCSLEEYLQNSSLFGYFFPPDPTETTASIGGIIACNSSGAASYRYGPARKYINSLKIVLSDGSLLHLKRGGQKTKGRSFSVYTQEMKRLSGSIPGYDMPKVKNTAGYYSADNMDLLDIFIGSEGTLGVITEAELILVPRPSLVWGMFFVFDTHTSAVNFTQTLGLHNYPVMSIEYFDSFSMDFVRTHIPFKKEVCGIYLQITGDKEDELMQVMIDIASLAALYGIDDDDIFTASSSEHMALLKEARHSVPEGINQLVDEIRKKYPDVTKLASDIAVPSDRLNYMMDMYVQDLLDNELIHAVFGHIGDNHLHVNIIARDPAEYERGKSLFKSWCTLAVSFGGTISAEHGTGKLKKDYLRIMYGDEEIDEMKLLKLVFDKKNILNKGNIF